jgi:hypothetical protein
MVICEMEAWMETCGGCLGMDGMRQAGGAFWLGGGGGYNGSCAVM